MADWFWLVNTHLYARANSQGSEFNKQYIDFCGCDLGRIPATNLHNSLALKPYMAIVIL
jgi:hypothetical protein